MMRTVSVIPPSEALCPSTEAIREAAAESSEAAEALLLLRNTVRRIPSEDGPSAPHPMVAPPSADLLLVLLVSEADRMVPVVLRAPEVLPDRAVEVMRRLRIGVPESAGRVLREAVLPGTEAPFR